MADVEITPDALAELAEVPRPIQRRIRDVFVRLTHWPTVSGVKSLRGDLAGSYRIRTGDYRVVFRVTERLDAGDLVTVWKIGYRGDVYG
jgi:mRNA-degrading endonuclease RelE of RelBE toxin-antitoxin system